MDLVRAHYAEWAPKAKKKFKEPRTVNLDVVIDYLKFLGTKNDNFQGIKRKSLLTTQPGTKKILDYIRKKLCPNDEHPVASTPIKKKATPPKTKTKQAETKAEIVDQEVAQVTGNHIPGHMEEKDVPFRQQQPDDDVLEPNDDDSDDSPYSDPDPSVHTVIGRGEHQLIKRLFRDHIDANPKIEIDRLLFDWSKQGGVMF